MDDWVTIMYRAMDSVGEGLQPSQNASPGSALFFVLFIFVGGIFIFQLFISVIISVYEDNMRTASGSDDKEQHQQLQRLLEFYSPDSIPPEPTNRIRRLCYNITTGPSTFCFLLCASTCFHHISQMSHACYL